MATRSSKQGLASDINKGPRDLGNVTGWATKVIELVNSRQEKAQSRYEDKQGNRYSKAGSEEALENENGKAYMAGQFAQFALDLLEKGSTKKEYFKAFESGEKVEDIIKNSFEEVTGGLRPSATENEIRSRAFNSIAMAWRRSTGETATEEQIIGSFVNEVVPMVDKFKQLAQDKSYGGSPTGIYNEMYSFVDNAWDAGFDTNYNMDILKVVRDIVDSTYRLADQKLKQI